MSEETQNSIRAVCATVALAVVVTLTSSCVDKMSNETVKMAEACVKAGGTWTDKYECYQ